MLMTGCARISHSSGAGDRSREELPSEGRAPCPDEGGAENQPEPMMAKKWYNLFLSVEPSGADAGEEAARGAPSADAEAARTVAEIAASIGDPPAFSASAGKLPSFDELYAAAEIRQPGHGYTILKIAEMLQSEHIRS